MQFLFLRDLGGADDPAALEAFFKIRDSSPSARSFCKNLLRGIIEHAEEIDKVLKSYSEHYELHRISAVDRNILRVGIYEMLYCPDVPPVVSINEAIEIAKKYSTEESGKFVNGILDRLKGSLSRAARTATPAQDPNKRPEASA